MNSKVVASFLADTSTMKEGHQ